MGRPKKHIESENGILTIRTAPIFQPLWAPARYQKRRSASSIRQKCRCSHNRLPSCHSIHARSRL